jgi:hypothetical protein
MPQATHLEAPGQVNCIAESRVVLIRGSQEGRKEKGSCGSEGKKKGTKFQIARVLFFNGVTMGNNNVHLKVA